MKKTINYSFHLGERNQSYYFLSQNKFISGDNPFSGTYVSFDVVIDIINNNFNDCLNNVAYLNISKKRLTNIVNKTNDFENIDELVQSNDFEFFHKENFYKNKDYCISLNYTDMDNFKINDMYYWKRYFVMPNVNYNTEKQMNVFAKRKKRFLDVLNNEHKDNILLIYQNKMISCLDVDSFIENVVKIYNLPFELFYIVPVDAHTNDGVDFDDKIVTVGNIVFYIVGFPNLEYQIANNPSDDNELTSCKEQYEKIKNKINELYDMKLVLLW